MRRLKVALVAPYFPPFVGGIETYIYELAKRLIDKNIIVYIFTSGNGSVEDFDGITIFRLRALDIKDSLFPLKIPYPIPLSLLFKLRKINVDVIHAHGHAFLTSFAAAIASPLTHTPLALTIHDIGVSYQESPLIRGIRPLFDSIFVNYIFRQTDLVIAQNDVTYAYASKFKPRKMVIIPQGIDSDKFKPTGEGEYITFIAARLVPAKGGETFIRAVPLVLEKVKEAKFRVIGDGIQRSLLERLCRELRVENHVHFEGSIDYKEIPAYLNEAKVTVFPGHSGLVLLEAAAAKRPIITIETAWAKDSLGDSPLFVPFGDSNETAKAIVHLLENPEERSKIADLAYRKVVSERDWDKAASRHITLYEQLVRERKHER